MDLDQFKDSLKQETPPENIPDVLTAMWYDAKGDWEKAHATAQEIHDRDGSWVHAYLHRKEGDEGNASYWYSRAGKSKCSSSLDDEWQSITENFLKNF